MLMRPSVSRRARARDRNSPFCESSNAEMWLRGRIQVSKGNRGANGPNETKCSFSETMRFPSRSSCSIMSQNTQRSFSR